MGNIEVLNDTCISENSENFSIILEMYLDGTITVFWKNQIYIMKEQKKKRIVCEDQSQRRLTSKD